MMSLQKLIHLAMTATAGLLLSVSALAQSGPAEGPWFSLARDNGIKNTCNPDYESDGTNAISRFVRHKKRGDVNHLYGDFAIMLATPGYDPVDCVYPTAFAHIVGYPFIEQEGPQDEPFEPKTLADLGMISFDAKGVCNTDRDLRFMVYSYDKTGSEPGRVTSIISCSTFQAGNVGEGGYFPLSEGFARYYGTPSAAAWLSVDGSGEKVASNPENEVIEYIFLVVNGSATDAFYLEDVFLEVTIVGDASNQPTAGYSVIAEPNGK